MGPTRAWASPMGLARAVVARNGRWEIGRIVLTEIAVEAHAAASPRVMVVDHGPAFRRAARAVIKTAGFQLLADAASGAEALRNADHKCPDLVLMEVYMPQMDGFEATRRLTEAHPGIVVVLVSLEDVDDLGDDVAACGAVAFLHKRDLLPATLQALWTTYRGDR